MVEISSQKKPADLVHYLTTLAEKCIDSERVRGLSERFLSELHHNMTVFNDYLRLQRLTALDDLKPETIRDFLLFANPADSASLGKAMVWSIRKFFAFLTLRQIIPANPARSIPHPKARPREKLPEYLKPAQLADLLQTAADERSQQDFTVLSLLATVGPRPHEIAKLRVKDLFLDQHYILLHVKGGWYKHTPISEPMAETLQEYVDEYAPQGPALFLNQWGRPIDRRWVERLVRDAALQAGIKQRVTPNTLRHTFATYAADRHGANITRALLGHCGRSHSTDVYMHLIPTKFRALMNSHPYQTVIRTPGRRR
jgi:integrase/recombinase XerD